MKQKLTGLKGERDKPKVTFRNKSRVKDLNSISNDLNQK